jgi:RNase P subunit RPR2
MKVIKNNYQKALGHVRCEECKSILRIENTDRNYEFMPGGKSQRMYFICGACGWKQYFMRKDLKSKKALLEEANPNG